MTGQPQFRKVGSGTCAVPSHWTSSDFKINIFDLPLISGENLGGMRETRFGWVENVEAGNILDAWHSWKDGEPMPEILKPHVSK